MVENRLGANSAMFFPSSHLSFQNKILFPLPIMRIAAMLKRALAFRGTSTWKPSQGRGWSIFSAQSHHIFSAQPNFSRFKIPNPHSLMGVEPCLRKLDNFLHGPFLDLYKGNLS